MQPASDKAPQQRLRRFIRQPEQLENRQLTDKGLELAATIARYRFLPSSQLSRLVSGGERNNYRHMQTLFHKGVINRFAIPQFAGSGEFIYYIDSKDTLMLLFTHGLLSPEEASALESTVRSNREKNYAAINKNPDIQGKLLFIKHELMISRFHFMLDMACEQLAGQVELTEWHQGADLWNRVEVPKVKPLHFDHDLGRTVWEELDKTEHLPHRPDAFFTLRFPSKSPNEQLSHFFYEADRGTENRTRFKMKLRSHYHFVVKQNRQRQRPYNAHAIRAVLTESTDKNWAQRLREAACENVVSPKPSPLFWFTTSEIFLQPQTVTNGKTQRELPLYLVKPETVLKRIWAAPSDDTFLKLSD